MSGLPELDIIVRYGAVEEGGELDLVDQELQRRARRDREIPPGQLAGGRGLENQDIRKVAILLGRLRLRYVAGGQSSDKPGQHPNVVVFASKESPEEGLPDPKLLRRFVASSIGVSDTPESSSEGPPLHKLEVHVQR